MFLFSDTVQATALHREASESGRASPKVHEGTLSEGYMGKKRQQQQQRKKERGKKKGGGEAKPNQQKATHTQKPHRPKNPKTVERGDNSYSF